MVVHLLSNPNFPALAQLSAWILFLDPIGDIAPVKIEIDADEHDAFAVFAVLRGIIFVFDLLHRFIRDLVQFEFDHIDPIASGNHHIDSAVRSADFRLDHQFQQIEDNVAYRLVIMLVLHVDIVRNPGENGLE